MDWASVAKLSREAFRDAVNDWIGKARIRGGQVKGPNAVLTPGSLTSDASIETLVQQKLMSGQVPVDIARAIAKDLAAVWNGWAAGFQVHVAGAYPRFAAFPGPQAPPTPAIPFNLSQGQSGGEFALSAPILAGKLSMALRLHASKLGGAPPDPAMKGLADWIESSFREWKAVTKIVGMMGKGSAPTFAPPYSPTAPVAVGENLSVGPVFAGPRFGKIVV